MIRLSAKEQWLADAGVRLLTDRSQQTLWADWSRAQGWPMTSPGLSTPIPSHVASVALAGLEALERAMRLGLDAPGLDENAEIDLMNDLEAVRIIGMTIARDLGEPPRESVPA